MPGRVPVPNRPETQDEDYALGDANWMNSFAQGQGQATSDSRFLGQQGQAMAQQAQAAQSRATPETEFGRSRAMGAQQTGAADWLQNFAQGPQGPSAAQAQLQQGANQSMDQNLALARAGSGFGESAAGLESAQRANAATMANASNQAAVLRAQEDQAFRNQQMQAMGTAADIYGGAAGREVGTAQFATQAELDAAAQRDALELGRSGQSIEAQNMGVQGQIASQGLGLDAQRAALEGRIAQGNTEADLYGTETEVYRERLRRDEALAEQRRANRGEAASHIGTAVAAIGSVLSDERSKKNARSAGLRARYAALSD